MWEEYKQVQGELSLNGHPIQELLAKRPQDVIFCGKSSYLWNDSGGGYL
jgi:hypothetical protein